MRCVDLYNQAQSKWFEEMVTTTLVCNSSNYPCKIVIAYSLHHSQLVQWGKWGDKSHIVFPILSPKKNSSLGERRNNCSFAEGIKPVQGCLGARTLELSLGGMK